MRAVTGDKQAYAYSDDISLAALDRGGASPCARSAGRGSRPSAPLGAARRGARAVFAGRSGRAASAEADKVALLERLEQRARARDPRVTQVMASLAGEHETILIARSDGLVAADVRPLVRMSITVIVEENGRREQGYSGGGGRFDYAYFTDDVLDRYAQRSGRRRRCSICRRARRRPAT